MVRSKRGSCGLAGGRRRVKRGSWKKYSNAHKEMLGGRKENWVKLYSPSSEMLGGRRKVKRGSCGTHNGGKRKRGTHHEMKTKRKNGRHNYKKSKKGAHNH